MKINCLRARFAICRFKVGTPLPALETLSFYSLSSDTEGLRLVLKEKDMPKRIRGASRGWRALHFLDENDNSEQRLNLLCSRLNSEEIESFVAPTYEMSFLFVHNDDLQMAMDVMGDLEYQWL
ncbi:hypothetical protein BGC07_10985 [Piscirickettsia litoralis]|uniref:Aspartate kinase n=2 Tax=Piscirickettsia litoralis TaxID=1891921 RepID=A0ABX3A3A6_9GAMM|nr:hypothetical protein BGC07_10985 [Piscirickettsia litoralis]